MTSRGDIPFLRLRARGRVGSDYFVREGLVATEGSTIDGLVDQLSDHDDGTFVAGNVHPSVVHFYEHTAQYKLETSTAPPRWSWLLLRAFGVFARRVGQTDFPHGVPAAESTVTSTIFAIQSHFAGHSGVRAWVRTWSRGGSERVLYAAAYANHEHGKQRYLDIAFPFPFATLVSVLQFHSLRDGGTELNTANTSSVGRRDCGIWLLGRRTTIRTPLSESICVWPANAPNLPAPISGTGADVVAEHHIYLYQIRFLTLHYVARRS